MLKNIQKVQRNTNQEEITLLGNRKNIQTEINNLLDRSNNILKIKMKSYLSSEAAFGFYILEHPMCLLYERNQDWIENLKSDYKEKLFLLTVCFAKLFTTKNLEYFFQCTKAIRNYTIVEEKVISIINKPDFVEDVVEILPMLQNILDEYETAHDAKEFLNKFSEKYEEEVQVIYKNREKRICEILIEYIQN